jgi:lipoprotein signal peptidase
VPRKLTDVLLTVATLVVLLGLIGTSSPALRQHLQELVANPQQWESIEGSVNHTVESGTGVLFGYATGHSYQFTFLVAACVFVVLMLKVIR